MAKMHSRKKGKAKSRPPASKVPPAWVEYPAHEIEDLVLKFYREEGMRPTQIGLLLRDTYGIPNVKVICGKSIVKIIEASGEKIEYPDDLMSLIRKALKMRKHIDTNHQDQHNKKKLHDVESKIRRLVAYYTGCGKLPADWVYDPEKAALITK